MLKKTIGFLSLSLILGACGNAAVEEPPVEESTVSTAETVGEETVNLSVSIEVSGETIEDLSSDIEAEAGQTLMEIMTQEYTVEEEGGFLSSIEGYEQDPDNNRWWLYEVNGEQPTVGAEDYVVEDGDDIAWMLNDL